LALLLNSERKKRQHEAGTSLLAGSDKAGYSTEVVRKFLLNGLPIYDVAGVVPIYACVCCQAQENGF
jgi:hypothetical protein